MLTLAKQTMYDFMYMKLAQETSLMSYDERKKVGCVIVLPNGLISHGWNGMPSNMTNVCQYRDDEGNLVTKPEVIHAEANALDKLVRSTLSSVGATAYLTTSPCMPCALRLYTAGIVRVVYEEEYRILDGVEFLKERGVSVLRLEMPC